MKLQKYLTEDRNFSDEQLYWLSPVQLRGKATEADKKRYKEIRAVLHKILAKQKRRPGKPTIMLPTKAGWEQVKKHLKESRMPTPGKSCPIASEWFGEMPTAGGYSSNTEWEIGAQYLAEAAHCIIGSLGKFLRNPFDLGLELGHIREEMGIIEDKIKEYGKWLYTNRFRERVTQKEKWALGSLKSVKKNSPTLRKKAKSALSRLDKSYPKLIYDTAKLCYEFIINLASSMEDAVGWVDEKGEEPYRKHGYRGSEEPVFIKNPYRHEELIKAKDRLAKQVKKLEKYKAETLESMKKKKL